MRRESKRESKGEGERERAAVESEREAGYILFPGPCVSGSNAAVCAIRL